MNGDCSVSGVALMLPMVIVSVAAVVLGNAGQAAQQNGGPLTALLVLLPAFWVLVLVALAVAIVLGIVLAQTRFGRYTYAIGSNPEAARRALAHLRAAAESAPPTHSATAISAPDNVYPIHAIDRQLAVGEGD